MAAAFEGTVEAGARKTADAGHRSNATRRPVPRAFMAATKGCKVFAMPITLVSKMRCWTGGSSATSPSVPADTPALR